MKYLSLLFVLLFCVVSAAHAQDKKSPVKAFSSDTPEERGSTRVLYYQTEKDAFSFNGELAIDYGRPAWKKEYENQAAFDGFTKGKVWRFGKDFWTRLDTGLPLTIAGKQLAPGLYYLGLHRSADGGTWSVAFIDPVKARKTAVDSAEIGLAPVEFKAPASLEKAATSADKLTILLSANKQNVKDVTLKITWGTLQLSVPIQVGVSM